MQEIKAYAFIVGGIVVVFIIGLIPYFLGDTHEKATLFYGSLFFAVLLGASISLLLLAGPHSATDGVRRDYRVVHYTLRLALAFGIGAVIVGVLLMATLLGLQLF